MMLALVACAGTGDHGKFTAPAGSAEAEAWQLGSLATNVFRFKQANLVRSGAQGAVAQERPNAALKAESLYCCFFPKLLSILWMVWVGFYCGKFFQEELYPPLYTFLWVKLVHLL